MAFRPAGLFLLCAVLVVTSVATWASLSSLRSPPVKAAKAAVKPNTATSAMRGRGKVPVPLPQNAVSLSGSVTSTPGPTVLATSLKKTTAEPQNTEAQKWISGSLTLSYSQSLVDHKDGNREASSSGLLIATGPMTTHWSWLGKLVYEENLRNNEDLEDGISDLSLIFPHSPWALAPWVNGTWALTAVIPMSEYSTTVTNLKFNGGTTFKLGLNPQILVPGFEAGLTFGLSRNIHQYETTTSGDVLNPWSFREILSLGYTYEKWSLSFEGIHRHLFSYQNNVTQNFEHTEEVGYQFHPLWKGALGHTNRGLWLKANAQDSNLSVFNEDSSNVYGSIEMAF